MTGYSKDSSHNRSVKHCI
uniref:Uncharacterized protein n=1 Tax=Arundo donax TaxID=35708 RepID=A0A0A8ZJX0_ARUDO